MDIPLAQNHIGIRTGFKGYRRKSSTFSHQADVDGLFVLYGDEKNYQVLVTSTNIASLKDKRTTRYGI